jgi:hypothetical protein
MIKRIYEELYGKIPESFLIPCSPEEAAKILSDSWFFALAL